MSWKCSTFFIILYSKIKILSTPAIIQAFIQFGEMKKNNTLFPTDEEDLKTQIKLFKKCLKKVISASTQQLQMAWLQWL